MAITQIILVFFLLFALSRVVVRFRSAEISFPGLLLWSSIFGIAIVSVLFPFLTSSIARMMGIGRGADAAIYVSIVLLFYLVFRLYVYMQDVRREISKLVTQIALKDLEQTHDSTAKN